MEQQTQKPSDWLKTTQVLFYAMVGSDVVYLVMCELIRIYVLKPGQQGFAPLQPDVYNIVRIAAYGIGVVLAAMIIRIKLGLQNQDLGPVMKLFFGATLKSQAEDKSVLQTIIVMAAQLSTSISVFGVVLFLLNGIRADAYILIIAGALLLLLFNPTAEMMERVRELRKKAAGLD